MARAGPTKGAGDRGRGPGSKKCNRRCTCVGRGAQLLGMWMLLVDIFTAGPLGPDPKLFMWGVGAFLGGWGLTKVGKQA